jgi:hypothetical protein
MGRKGRKKERKEKRKRKRVWRDAGQSPASNNEKSEYTHLAAGGNEGNRLDHQSFSVLHRAAIFFFEFAGQRTDRVVRPQHLYIHRSRSQIEKAKMSKAQDRQQDTQP